MFEYPRETLIKLDNTRNREIFARVTVLDKFERPIETIEGKITGNGSINVDGNSAVRRTISLSMVAQDVKIHNVYWGLTSRVQVSIGLRDMDAGNNSQIYWFKAGVYVLTEFRTQQSLNNLTISLSGKDKMCLLNGEVGGHFTADTDLGTLEETNEEGLITNTALKISTIIREMLVGIGGELPQNIILNNVDDYGVEMLTYKGSDTLYVLFNTAENLAVHYYIGDNTGSDTYYYTNESRTYEVTDFSNYSGLIKPLSEVGNGFNETFIISDGNNVNYAVYQVLQNQACGYRLTELTYPGGELIARVGETITSVLDKIKNQFGTFEYFYDIDGHFVFQLKQIYSNRTYNTRTDYTLSNTESYVENSYDFSKYSYYFNNNNLITALNNTPQLGSVKNDFAIWGQNANGLSIHLRYAIDRKPDEYCNIDGQVYSADSTDWRELIYQMALDWFKYYHHGGITDSAVTADNFTQILQDNNRDNELGKRLRLFGKTGYEQYYTDLQGFWRYLYNPNPDEEDVNYDRSTGYNLLIEQDPASLLFYFDFLDADDSEVGSYSVYNIGDRTKTSNNNAVKVIKYEEVPNILFNFVDEDIDYEDESAQRIMEGYYDIYYSINDKDYFDIAARGKSCYDELDNLLYNCTYINQSISLTTLPIYYLEPNTLIYIKDETNDINGEYAINRMTIPLTYNGTMSITANKVPQRLY